RNCITARHRAPPSVRIQKLHSELWLPLSNHDRAEVPATSILDRRRREGAFVGQFNRKVRQNRRPQLQENSCNQVAKAWIDLVAGGGRVRPHEQHTVFILKVW